VADMRTWSTLTGLADVVDGLRPQLRAFRDESGRELLDIEDGPILTGDEEAPVRFLPEYDNLTLAHDDRARIAGAWYPEAVLTRGALLVDGFGVGAWTVRRDRGAATLEIDQFTDLSTAQRTEVEAEADALLAFVASDAEAREVRLNRYR
jgi:Winged helix DNA-binding domain